MADQDFDVSPRDIPGRRDRLRDLDDELDDRRIHAPGGSVVVTVPIVMPGDRGRRDDWHDHDHHHELPVPPPSTLPLVGSELIEMFQSSLTFPFWRRVTTNVLDFIRQFWPASWSWKTLNAKADTPTTLLFTVGSIDQVFEIVTSVACKTQDAGAGVGTLTVNFAPLDGTTTPITQSCNLAITGNGATSSTLVLLAAGTGVTFDFSGGGPYGAASYDLVVSAIPKSSDKASQQQQNLLW